MSYEKVELQSTQDTSAFPDEDEVAPPTLKDQAFDTLHKLREFLSCTATVFYGILGILLICAFAVPCIVVVIGYSTIGTVLTLHRLIPKLQDVVGGSEHGLVIVAFLCVFFGRVLNALTPVYAFLINAYVKYPYTIVTLYSIRLMESVGAIVIVTLGSGFPLWMVKYTIFQLIFVEFCFCITPMAINFWSMHKATMGEDTDVFV